MRLFMSFVGVVCAMGSLYLLLYTDPPFLAKLFCLFLIGFTLWLAMVAVAKK